MQIFIKVIFILLNLLILLLYSKCSNSNRLDHLDKLLIDTINSAQIQNWPRNFHLNNLILNIPFQDTLFRKGQVVTSQWSEFADGIEYYTSINGTVLTFRLIGVRNNSDYVNKLKDIPEIIIFTENKREKCIISKTKKAKMNSFVIWNDNIGGYIKILFLYDDRLEIAEKYLVTIGKNISGFMTNSRTEDKKLINNLSLHNIDSKIDTIF